MTAGTLDAALVRRHLAALDQAVTNLRRHRGNVDLGRVHAVLNDHLDDFTEFARHVDGWVRSETS